MFALDSFQSLHCCPGSILNIYCCTMVDQNVYPNVLCSVTYPDYVPKPSIPTLPSDAETGVTFWLSISTHQLNSQFKFLIQSSPLCGHCLNFNRCGQHIQWTFNCKNKNLESHLFSEMVPLADYSVLRQCHMLKPCSICYTSNKANSSGPSSIYQDNWICRWCNSWWRTAWLISFQFHLAEITLRP